MFKVRWLVHRFIYFYFKVRFNKALISGLLSPGLIFALLHLLTVSPRPEFAQMQLCLKKDNTVLDIGIRPVVNSPAGNEVRK